MPETRQDGPSSLSAAWAPVVTTKTAEALFQPYPLTPLEILAPSRMSRINSLGIYSYDKLQHHVH